MSTYQRSIRPQEQQPERSSIQCVAEGCPLPGTFNPDMRGKHFFCRAHDGMNAIRWPAITESVRARPTGVEAAADLQNAPAASAPGEPVIRAFMRMFGEEKGARQMKTYGFPEQKPPRRGLQPETARDYGNRMYLELLREVRGEPAAMPAETQRFIEQLKPTRPPVDIEI